MSTTAIALVVAAIAGGAGVIQGLLQGLLQARASNVSVRSDHIRGQIVQLVDIRDALEGGGRAANAYALNLPELSMDSSGWEQRWTWVEPMLIAHGTIHARLYSLTFRHQTKRAIEKVAALLSELGREDKKSEISKQWNSEGKSIGVALECVAREIRQRQEELRRATWWGPVRWVVNHRQKEKIHSSTLEWEKGA
jgi:uncharacterized protein YoaH (UPF0181 family)